MNVLDGFLMVTAVVGALWWAFARHRAPVALEWLSFAGLGRGVLAVALEGVLRAISPSVQRLRMRSIRRKFTSCPRTERWLLHVIISGILSTSPSYEKM